MTQPSVLTNTITNQTDAKNQIDKALQYLSGVCDGAVTLDGAGFNGFDSGYGKHLAEISRSGKLSDVDYYNAGKMIQKYRNQVERAGYQLPTLTQLNDVGITGTVVVNIDTVKTWITVRFDYHKQTVADVKSIPGSIYNPKTKTWGIPGNNVKLVADKFDPNDHNWSPTALDWLQNGMKVSQDVHQDVHQDVSVSVDGDNLIVSFPYNADRVAKVKSLITRKYDPNTKTWIVPTRLIGELKALFPEAIFTPEAQDVLTNLITRINLSNEANGTFDVPGLNGDLYPFQSVGVKFLEKADGRALIADEMGLGKTIQSIGWLQLHPTKRPVIIVVPASLKINWLREIGKWMTTQDQVHIITGRKNGDGLPDADIYIINYDILSSWVDHLISINPQVVIFDEAHYAKNHKAKRTQVAKSLAHKTPHVILLTGTPVLNRPNELFSLLNMIDPQGWNNFYYYGKRYCGLQETGFGLYTGGATNLEELHEKTRYITIRRTKEQVLSDLPAKLPPAVVVVDFDPKQRKQYNQAVSDCMDDITIAAIEKIKQAAVKGKLPAAINWIDQFLSNDEKLVVFCTHHFVVDTLVSHYGDRCVKLTGNESSNQKQIAVDKFQSDPNVVLFVGNIKAAGVGITLTASSNVAFLELDWTPAMHDQAVDRTHRIGQTNPVTTYYLIADGTYEEDIISLLNSKRSVVDTVTDGIATGERDLSVLGDLMRIIRKDKQDRDNG